MSILINEYIYMCKINGLAFSCGVPNNCNGYRILIFTAPQNIVCKNIEKMTPRRRIGRIVNYTRAKSLIHNNIDWDSLYGYNGFELYDYD